MISYRFTMIILVRIILYTIWKVKHEFFNRNSFAREIHCVKSNTQTHMASNRNELYLNKKHSKVTSLNKGLEIIALAAAKHYNFIS